LTCAFCSKPISATAGKTTRQRNAKPSLCLNCKKPLPRCSICRISLGMPSGEPLSKKRFLGSEMHFLCKVGKNCFFIQENWTLLIAGSLGAKLVDMAAILHMFWNGLRLGFKLNSVFFYWFLDCTDIDFELVNMYYLKSEMVVGKRRVPGFWLLMQVLVTW